MKNLIILIVVIAVVTKMLLSIIPSAQEGSTIAVANAEKSTLIEELR